MSQPLDIILYESSLILISSFLTHLPLRLNAMSMLPSESTGDLDRTDKTHKGLNPFPQVRKHNSRSVSDRYPGGTLPVFEPIPVLAQDHSLRRHSTVVDDKGHRPPPIVPFYGTSPLVSFYGFDRNM